MSTEAKLLLIGIPVLLWTMLPIYHMLLFAISPKQSAFEGNLWPEHPTLNNFAIVFEQKHYYLNHFWQQLVEFAGHRGRDRRAHPARRDLRGLRHQPPQGAAAGAR